MNDSLSTVDSTFNDSPLAQREANQVPFLTIAIPQYNRRRYLEANLASIFAQTYKNFEIVVSDDGSTDDSNEVIPSLLGESGCVYRYYAQRMNLGYDRNVRFCLSAARGEYVMLLGNDDSLVASNNLSEIAKDLESLQFPEVAITNYQDWESGKVRKRTYGTCLFGSGPRIAARYFRSFSFVSGIIYKVSEAKKHETDKWDASIYYQIYLACRIVAAGGRMAGLDIDAVRDHVRIDGQLFPGTYRVKYKGAPFTMRWKHTGLDSVARVTIDAILPYVDASSRTKTVSSIWSQILLINYPFWVLEYRQVANWGWGFGVARDLWPADRLREYNLPWHYRLWFWLIYLCTTAAALIIPPALFARIKDNVANFVRKRRSPR